MAISSSTSQRIRAVRFLKGTSGGRRGEGKERIRSSGVSIVSKKCINIGTDGSFQLEWARCNLLTSGRGDSAVKEVDVSMAMASLALFTFLACPSVID